MNKQTLFKIIVDTISICFLILFPHFVPLPFYSYAVVCFLFILVFLKREGSKLSDIGLKPKGIRLGTIIAGICTGLSWIAFMQWLYIPFIMHFFKSYVKSYTEYDFIRNHVSNLLITIAASWVIAGFYEETVFRGFIQTIIQRWMKERKYSFWVSGIATSILFGLYHIQQGVFGVIPAMLGGLYWTAMLKYFRGNLWYVIISHAVYDTAALIMIYSGVFGK